MSRIIFWSQVRLSDQLTNYRILCCVLEYIIVILDSHYRSAQFSTVSIKVVGHQRHPLSTKMILFTCEKYFRIS